MAKIENILALEQIENDIFRGIATETLLQRTFGGQVAGQSLVSAVRTVDPAFGVHSLHGYFLRPGNPDKAIVYQVERIREGRSFCTRRVTAVQDGKAIFTMSASFHIEEQGIEHQDVMPAVPMPDELTDAMDSPEPEYRWVHEEWAEWEFRFVPQDRIVRRPGAASQQQLWFRSRLRLPDDPVLHVCTLAYMSDMTLLGSAMVIHKDEPIQGASLDHAMWFMRPFRADDWLLYDQTSPAAGFGRALTQGKIFDSRGQFVAAVVQEGLSRTPH